MGPFLVLVSFVSFLMALLSLAFRYKHLLNVLLSLEALTMSIFILLFSLFSTTISGEAALIFITLGVCEASLGLSVLVSMIRARGNDYVSSFSTQKC
uniref:NADH dehydrogenase subunit 4L n=1 Tax=Koreoleptoxis friniana TaxID=2582462 RepID=UPI002A837E78|nr:NADH dehydrogenase subunit 4L [Koreoleptoxis friniana]WOC29677.1 NADH dehydrogenase subunit 4L [Koreoleptoxis friniana]WOC88157.1 NADH dehydrogenase subunit 4L [Koreoleptoxis friniana]